MSCCGGPRKAAPSVAFAVTAGGTGAISPNRPDLIVQFEYLGKTALTAKGPVTGRTYRFCKDAAVVRVDARDMPGMLSIPMLRLIPQR